LRLSVKTADAERPPVKLDATEVVAPRSVTVARVSDPPAGGALVQFEPSEVRTLPEVPGATMGMLPDAVPLRVPTRPPRKVCVPVQVLAWLISYCVRKR
jgi:hypothetical protein